MLTLGMMMAAVTIGGIFWMYGRDLPSYDVLASYTPKTISRIYSGEGRIIDDGGRLASDDDVIIIDESGDRTGGKDRDGGDEPGLLFGGDSAAGKKKVKKKKTARKAGKGRSR